VDHEAADLLDVLVNGGGLCNRVKNPCKTPPLECSPPRTRTQQGFILLFVNFTSLLCRKMPTVGASFNHSANAFSCSFHMVTLQMDANGGRFVQSQCKHLLLII
jgi:hypothetical protein